MSDEAKGTGSESRRLPAWLERIKTAPARFRQFLHEVRQEMTRVTWPTRDDVKATTTVVILTIFFFGLYFFGVDWAIVWLVEQVLNLKF